MKDISTALLGLVFLIIFLIWFAALTLGSAEVLWWIFTGDFFHFVNTEVVATF